MIEMRNITKTYEMGTQAVHALRGIDLKIGEGDFLAIMGPSCSGKSTLINQITRAQSQVGHYDFTTLRNFVKSCYNLYNFFR